MLRIFLLALVAISFIPLSSVFAEGSIEIQSEQKVIAPNDSVFVYGKATGITKYVPITLQVLAPDGEVVFSPNIQVDDDGIFKRLIHPPLPSFRIGTYTVIASHEDLKQVARLTFEVKGKSLVNDTNPPPGTGDRVIFEGLKISAKAKAGSDTITINGTAVSRDTDVTFSVHSPQGNLVTVKQVSPNKDGSFTTTIKTGGPLWTEDGVYTVTANQGIASEFEDTAQVEISKGRVIPEFGTIAAMILVISLVSIIAVSAKSKMSIVPRF